MSKNVCNQVDIPCLFVKSSAIRTPELVRRDLFVGCHFPGIFPDHIFNSLDTHTPALGGKEEGVFMTLQRSSVLPGCIDVGLELQKGQVLGLVGENGAGKSTLATILSAVQKADSGNIKNYLSK